MAGHDHHRLGEPQPLLLHDRGGEAKGFARSDRVGDIGRAGSDDAPDRVLLCRAVCKALRARPLAPGSMQCCALSCRTRPCRTARRVA
jgi:hypothetical protein